MAMVTPAAWAISRSLTIDLRRSDASGNRFQLSAAWSAVSNSEENPKALRDARGEAIGSKRKEVRLLLLLW